jgi:hypothetical protein
MFDFTTCPLSNSPVHCLKDIPISVYCQQRRISCFLVCTVKNACIPHVVGRPLCELTLCKTPRHQCSLEQWQKLRHGSVPSIVSWIQIRIRILWASLSRSRILLSSSKNSKKNLYSFCFVTSLWLFILEKWCKCSSKSNKQNNSGLRIRINWLEARIPGSGSGPKWHGSTTLTFQYTVTNMHITFPNVDWSTCTKACPVTPVTLNTLKNIL